MRIALISDIHGNALALDAVLQDIARRGGVDATWFIGDYCALGPDPVAVLERITALPDAVFVRGNTDDYTVTDHRPPPTPEQALTEPELLPKLLEVASSFAWTCGGITAHGWFDWLADLPIEQRMTLPDGTRVLLVHAEPGRFGGPGISLHTTDEDLAARLAGCEADLVVVGHIHWPQDRVAGGVRLVNPGSVSNAPAADLRASYAVIEADESGHQITFHRVEYDLEAAIAAVRAVHHPVSDFLIHFLEGKWTPPWLDAINNTPYTPDVV